MADRPTASVVITNHNYASYVGAAIDSALAQTYEPVEVVVVDDGSTDHSRAVIESYRGSIRAVLQDNRGQDVALGEGFRQVHGDVVCFLDADDVLLPTALEHAVDAFGPGVSKVHWPLTAVDGAGEPLGWTVPHDQLGEGDLGALVVANGPGGYPTPPMSGCAWARSFLRETLPVPPRGRPGGADSYLSMLAPFFGTIAALREAHGLYRVHGANSYFGRMAERLPEAIVSFDRECELLATLLRERGITPDVEAWKDRSWLHRLDRALRDIETHVPPREPFLLVDEDQWASGAEVAGRPRIPFPQREGVYWGLPADDGAALGELTSQVRLGVRYVVVGWPAFWWISEYRRFGQYLRDNAQELERNDRVVIWEIR